jgi:hypothetical protein
MSRDVTDWLRGLGLGRYAAAFRDNEIDWEALARLTAEDLIGDAWMSPFPSYENIELEG